MPFNVENKRRSETLKVPQIRFKSMNKDMNTINEKSKESERIDTLEEKIKKLH